MSEQSSKIGLITGATSGIGKSVAIQLAALGYRLIIISRNENSGNKLASLLRRKYNTDVQFFRLDISSLDQIRSFAKNINLEYHHIDLLINNAGARFDQPNLSVDGYELTFATNYLGHFLLTNLLIELLKLSDSARIINIVSNAHYNQNNNITYQLSEEAYNRHAIYGKSKLAQVMFTYYLAEKLKNYKINVNAYNPGYVASNFARNNGFLPWIKFRLLFFMKRKLRSSKEAANDLVYLATSNKLSKITAKYFSGKNEVDSSKASYDRNAAEALWELSEILCKMKF